MPKRPEPARVVRAVLAVESRLAIVDVDLHPPAIELDLVQQSGPTGGILASVGAMGLMNGILRNMLPDVGVLHV